MSNDRERIGLVTEKGVEATRVAYYPNGRLIPDVLHIQTQDPVSSAQGCPRLPSDQGFPVPSHITMRPGESLMWLCSCSQGNKRKRQSGGKFCVSCDRNVVSVAIKNLSWVSCDKNVVLVAKNVVSVAIKIRNQLRSTVDVSFHQILVSVTSKCGGNE